MNLDKFFATARERERIRRKRLDGQPHPWTDDQIFQQFRFTNVHREHDRTTEWFRENVRKHLTEPIHAVQATMIFRWFNRVETGELIKDLLLERKWNEDEAHRRLEGVRPVVTGAYMIKSIEGMNKLDGLLLAIQRAIPRLEGVVWGFDGTLKQATTMVASIENLGGFLAYEIVSDLRWTPVLSSAPDIMTWAHIGPGARKGLEYTLEHEPWRWNHHREDHQEEMRPHLEMLLKASTDSANWPAEWEPWEMREVEHWLCEHFKYCYAEEGYRPKRRYNYAPNGRD